MTIDSAVSTPRIAQKPKRPLSYFEFWPDWMFYTPVVIHWLMLGVRYGDFSLPTAANPGITTGGLCGESKMSILSRVGPEMQSLIAPACGVLARPDGTETTEIAMKAHGLTYPVVAKPDIGCRYLESYPSGETIVLQQYMPEPNEAGIFYVRHPDEPTGRITSLTIKQPPIVVGDGRSTLQDLILADERAGKVPHLYMDRLADRLDSVPEQGEKVQLVFVGNHCKGSIFQDGRALVTPELTAAIEKLVRSIQNFYFGRIDVRFASVTSLRHGTGFRVIEINGAGSEATHIWDPSTKLLDAWRTQFFHYGAAFRIGAANRRRGFSSSGVRAIYRNWMNQRRLMAQYPLND